MRYDHKYYENRLSELNGQFNLNFEQKIWDGKITKEVEKNYRISLCTTCMNRAKDLKDTLPVNIETNSDYDNVEFVILDYNSQDDLADWVKNNLMGHIETGKVAYYKTETPKFYSMTKSRNLAFKVATGDIVNNIDADNFINEGFVSYLNKLANQQTKKATFAKGKKMLRGRLGFWKQEFMEILQGYDESIEDYGHDDHDLMNRAWLAGFTLMWYGGKYYTGNGSKKHQTHNMKDKNWRLTEIRNKVIAAENIAKNKIAGNDREWGKDILIKNFEEEVVL